MMKIAVAGAASLFWILVAANPAIGQTEVSGWGNLRGIRTNGQLLPFTTAVGIFSPDFTQLMLSQREGPTHTTKYSRDDNTVTVGVNLQYGRNGRGAAPRGGPPIGGFNYSIRYTDSAPGACDVQINLTSAAAQTIGGIYYFLTLPGDIFANGAAEFIGAPNPENKPLPAPGPQRDDVTVNCTGIRFSDKKKTAVEVDFPHPLDVVVQHAHGIDDVRIYFPILIGNTTAGQTATANFTIKISAVINTTPVMITIDPQKLGRTWLGIGGNYRIQTQPLDSLHIQYILDNMRVAYGRVAMPWNIWQPEENSPPPLTIDAQTQPTNGRGGVMNSIPAAMSMAQTLAQKNIPMIISCWSAPNWALASNDAGRGGRRQRLDPAKLDKICDSIGSYLLYLKKNYGAEPQYFSFNESNIGINVLQTPADHDQAIKKLGAYFQSIGLKTKMLLGDTGDAPPIDFIQIALNDPEAMPYIGAISFHSWRGATDAQYQKWADAATKLGVPLFDAEGGNDAQAWSYPAIFREQWYALDEAAEYVRIMHVCQPAAILQWQLTENYSVLSTDDAGRLHPTQRFYNLKQFNLAPANAVWMSTESSDQRVLAASFLAKEKATYVVHLVNNGAARTVTLNGLPPSLTTMDIYVTDKDRGMAKTGSIALTGGTAKFMLEQQTLTTLTNAAP